MTVFQDWVRIFPGKMGLAWKLASEVVTTKEEAEKLATRNCNVIAVPLQLWEHLQRIYYRPVFGTDDAMPDHVVEGQQ